MKNYFSIACALLIATASFSQTAVADITASSLTICAGDTITFTDNSIGGSISDWNWTFTSGTPATANTQGPHQIIFNTAGSHNINLTITDTSGIDDTTITVTVTNCINAAFTTSADTICAGDSIIFTDASTSSLALAVWNWNYDNLNAGSANPSSGFTQGPDTVFYTTPGTYSVQLIVSDGSIIDTVSHTVVVTDCSPIANFTINGTMPLCEDACTTFNNLSSNNPTSYLWTFPGGTPNTSTTANPGNICYDSAGVYSVSLLVTNQYGSHQFDSPNSINIINCDSAVAGILMDNDNGELCDNGCITFTFNDTLGGVPDELIWTFEGNTNDTLTTPFYTTPIQRCWVDTLGEFIVSVSAINSYNNTVYSVFYDTIVIHPSPIIYAGEDIFVDYSDDTYIRAEVRDAAGDIFSPAGGTIEWSPSTYLTSPNELGSDAIQVLDSVIYTVTYTDINGCVATDDVKVDVNFVFDIDVPSAFTPNAAVNNLLFVKGKISIKTLSFMVYNRYGQKVFETSNIDEGWDGTHNGKELNPGVFVYFLKVSYVDGSTGALKGNVTLIK